MLSSDEKILEALKKFDTQTKERLAKKILDFAGEEPMSTSQKNAIRALKIISPIALFFCAPIVTFFYVQSQKGTDPLVFQLTLIPLVFLAIICGIVNAVLKTPD